MAASFEEIDKHIKDIAIIGRKIAVCYDNQEPLLLEGTVDEIVFDSESWNTTVICSDANNQIKFIYSMILNHKLYKELQLMARTRRILIKNFGS